MNALSFNAQALNTRALKPLVRSLKAIASKGMAVLVVAVAVLVAMDAVVPQSAAAYPFWAQQTAPETPREATGRIVCANCHLAKKPVEVEFPQAVLPDTVFKGIVKIPYADGTQQIQADGSAGGLNVGAVVMLPEGFKLAPSDRIPEKLQEEVGDVYFQTYKEGQDNVIIFGPLPGDQHREVVLPLLSPDPKTDKTIHFGKYSIYVGANRGRGQIYPTGEKSNNNAVTASAAGVVSDVAEVEGGGYSVTIQTEDGSTVTNTVPAGPSLVVAAGDTVKAGAALSSDPNVGGFGQHDTEIVLQSSARIVGLLVFFAGVMLTQILLVLKKKQFEKVQAAELNF